MDKILHDMLNDVVQKSRDILNILFSITRHVIETELNAVIAHSEPEPQPESQPEPQPESQPEPEPQPESQPEPQPESQPEPEKTYEERLEEALSILKKNKKEG